MQSSHGQPSISRRKLLAVCLGFLLLGATFTATYIYAVSPSNTFTISGGIYPGTPSFTVWVDAGEYYVKDSVGSLVTSSDVLADLYPTILQSNSRVLFKNGTYITDMEVDISGITNLEIEGEGGTTFKNSPTNLLSVFFVSTTSSNITLTNFDIDGSDTNGTYNFAMRIRGSNTIVDKIRCFDLPSLGVCFEHGATYCKIMNSYIYGTLRGPFGVGIVVNNCSLIQIVNNFVNNVLEGAVDIYEGAHDVLVTGNIFANCVGGGVVCEYWYDPTFVGDPSVHDVVISNNIISSCGYGGNGLFGNTTGETGGYGGVLLQSVRSVTIANNKIHDCGRGILIGPYRGMSLASYGAQWVTITGNDITASSYYNATKGEGILLDNVWYASISNNLIHANYGHGLYINHSSCFLTIGQNTFHGNGIGINNTYAQIYIEQKPTFACSYITISDTVMNTYSTASHNCTKYGIYDEVDPTEHLVISNVFATDHTTADIYLASMNAYTTITNSWNGSVFISNWGSISGMNSTQNIYTYMVVATGSSYQMINGLDGQVEFTSTNASAVINNALGNASAVKGSVFIKAGDYPISYNVEANFNNTLIMGEGVGTRLYLPNNQSASAEYHRIFYLNNCENVTIKNIQFDGNWVYNDWEYFSSNILIQNCRHVNVEGCTIQNHRVFGATIEATTGEECYDVNFLNNRLINNGYNHVQYASDSLGSMHDCLVQDNYCEGASDIALNTASASGNAPYRISFVHNMIVGGGDRIQQGSSNCYYGIRLEGGYGHLIQSNTVCDIGGDVAGFGILDSAGTHDNTISDNIIFVNGTSPYAGIAVSSENTTVRDNTIFVGWQLWQIGIDLFGINNTVVGNTISKLGTLSFVGIGSDTSSTGNFVCDNHIIGCPQNEAIQLVSGNIVRDNEGFVTENWISGANTTATTTVMNHGCASTPDFVFVSFNFTGWTSWTWTATTTQITITVTGTLPASYTVYAYVKYEL